MCSYCVFSIDVSTWLTQCLNHRENILKCSEERKKLSTNSSLLLYIEQYILSHYILFVSLPFCSQYEETRLILFPVKAWQLFCWFVWHYIWAALMRPRLLGWKEQAICPREKGQGFGKERNLEPVFVRICTAKGSENSRIVVEVAKREMIFSPVTEPGATEANFKEYQLWCHMIQSLLLSSLYHKMYPNFLSRRSILVQFMLVK